MTQVNLPFLCNIYSQGRAHIDVKGRNLVLFERSDNSPSLPGGGVEIAQGDSLPGRRLVPPFPKMLLIQPLRSRNQRKRRRAFAPAELTIRHGNGCGGVARGGPGFLLADFPVRSVLHVKLAKHAGQPDAHRTGSRTHLRTRRGRCQSGVCAEGRESAHRPRLRAPPSGAEVGLF